ncbi:FAD-binding oxidoreductase [Methylobacterium sp. WL64]|uniref:NAD(P)/FAD-dependent oxidoreductase n=1 Tax=Methylobacterium sp. WL64 TaxID=2603894 RepID=UPI0011C78E61|nr:FAD-binding oxidoreductase [Methylobacterium sp. WL64]TXN00407.1 FAD-binding oxidoreductase [Methylobacterium sp. WL64]
MTVREETTDVAIVGAGNIGLAVAYYLVVRHGVTNVTLVDSGDPMAMTSAQSGENYRNWWPHPTMTAYTDHAIDLLEEIAEASGNRIHMNRRGYALVTRRERPEDLIAELYKGYGDGGTGQIRIHEGGSAAIYHPPISADWKTAPDSVDVIVDRNLIRSHFPSLAPDVATIFHIRRAGDISGQQLGQYMLEAVRNAGGRIKRAAVESIDAGSTFALNLRTTEGQTKLRADRLVNAAGPFFSKVANMLGEDLPLSYIYQQKIAFEDREGAIPRDLPFTIDLDGQELAWTEEEREVLACDPDAALLLRQLPGGVHRRPEGSPDGRWIKLGWAYNTTPGDPEGEPPLDPNYPDVVLRGASRLHPGLRAYLGRLPRGTRHYGGYYAMTPENWPLIGPMRTPGAFMAGALSGFGTMAATATGAVCAAWMTGAELPAYASTLSLDRYADAVLMAELHESASKGVL